MTLYLEKINNFIGSLDQEVLAALNRISNTKIYKQGEYLLRQGEICRKSYTIEKGIVRKFYIDDGKERTTELYFKNDLAISFGSYCMQKGSRENIQALTEVTVSQIDYTAFQKAKKEYPQLLELDLMMTEYYAMWLEDRLFQFQTLDATQRYLKLLHEQSHIIQQVPLTCIASYIGISLETLSRIRARI